ncbi:MAG: hypothetical protein WBO45_22455 [Planctomycetota bacterium]
MARHCVVLCVVAGGCASGAGVHHVGVMREVMREGRTEARAALADHCTPGTFGVGALTGLQGEVTIDDGVCWVAVDGPAAVAAPPDATATLLTTAVVPRWRQLWIADPCDFDGIEAAIERACGGTVADGRVVPFVLDGRGRVALHVVRGACPHGEVPAGHEPARWSGDDTALHLVGFFVRGREGVMTHMGTSLHVHAFATDAAGVRVMGHVDALQLDGGISLCVPQ